MLVARSLLASCGIAGAVILGACSGNPASVVPTQPANALLGDAVSPFATAKKGTASFVIVIPVSTPSLRRPRYTSPATTGMGISILRKIGGTPIENRRVNVAAGAKGCTSTATSRRCTYNLSLAAGKYFVNASTWNPRGLHLSLGQSIPLTVTSSKTTVITLDLYGIPNSLLVSPGSSGISGSQNGGFTLSGSSPQNLIVNALDVSGNVIAGIGSPSYALSKTSGSGWTIQATPNALTPNLFTITPPKTPGSGAVVTLTATARGNVCKQSTAHCSTSFSIANPAQTLFVGGTCPSGCTNEVLGYTAPYTGTPITVDDTLGAITAMATDQKGDLFVANGDSTREYSPPYTQGAVQTISVPYQQPQLLAIAPTGELFVVSNSTVYYSGQVLDFYAAPYDGPPFYTGEGASVPGIAVDSNGTLGLMWCSNDSGNGCEEAGATIEKPPYTCKSREDCFSIYGVTEAPATVAFDYVSNFYIVYMTYGGWSKYEPPKYNVAVSGGRQNHGAYAMIFDATGTMFLANTWGPPNSVQIMVPPYKAPGQGDPSPGPYAKPKGPITLLLDGASNLLVVNGDGTATMRPPPYTGRPTPIATQLKTATAFAITP